MLPANLLIYNFISLFNCSNWYTCSTTKESEEGASVSDMSPHPG